MCTTQEDGRGEFLSAEQLGDHEYRFYRVSDGEPRGQIKVWGRVQVGTEFSDRRIPYRDLPQVMQHKFMQYAGVTDETNLMWGSRRPVRQGSVLLK